MSRTFFLAPAGPSAGLTTVALGLVRALDRRGLPVGFYKPIGQNDEGTTERSTHFIRETTRIDAADPISLASAESALGHLDDLLSRIISTFRDTSADAEIMIVEGLVTTLKHSDNARLNSEVAQALGAEVILVGTVLSDITLRDQFESAARPFGGLGDARIAGCILNRIPEDRNIDDLRSECTSLRRGGLPLIAAIPLNSDLTLCRTIDIARELDATIINEGEIHTRRVRSISVLARTVPNMLSAFRPGAALVTPTDRTDVVVAVAMAALNHVPIAGLLLTGTSTAPDQGILDLCRPALETGLPVLSVRTSSYDTAAALNNLSPEIATDDLDRARNAMVFVADHVDTAWIDNLLSVEFETRTSPAAFFHQLTERARAANARILLPEGTEPRTIRSAIHCQERGLARCVLLGPPDEIHRIARGEDLVIPEGLEIIDPEAVRENYVPALVDLRKAKNLSPGTARDQLTDTVMLGTVMLALGEGDGLVSGAVHSSANTVRPALQVIKTRPDARVVSSIFFMCLPDQVVVYGDCAVNTDPDAEALADIAIQSADSAEQFGIPARVAMISYSTGTSGSGADVDKVREATRIAQELRPDLLIDGPLQYDAAATADVAEKKAPDSPVAGRATVFIFPDLNTGNTTYKAVQRSANVISVGPMLQGLKRPVNDLSRGALVEDIIYTIALTGIQSEHNLDVVAG
ncbi:MAG: phosphate acetyltransferase [Chthoniobacterales bacterium]